MPANFDYLKNKSEYELFANACMEAEKVLSTSAAMSAIGSRKALELAVKWVYSADNTMSIPYKDSLQALIHEPSFKFALEPATWNKLPYIIKLGNLAVHTEKKINRSDAILSLKFLFEFIQWIDYCYGSEYVEREFKEEMIPVEKVALNEERIRKMESLISQKDDEIKALRQAIEKMSSKYTEEKEKHKKKRKFTAVDISEFQTRKKYIDVDLQLLGWTIGDDCLEEVAVDNMMNIKDQIGYVDYVLYGKDGLPLALIEAKRTSKDPNIGLQQAKLYADALDRKTGRRPIIFTTNGFETYIWDDKTSPQRKVSGIFSKSDLEKLINRRNSLKPLNNIAIDDKITDRYYQKEAIRAVCDAIEKGHRKHLLVMATGTGKTRTAASLVDVLSRGGYITNVLFLADRTALVKQAKDDFKNYLPDMSLCNLLTNKDDKNARIVFSTYPTMLNEIDSAKNESGHRLFSPAHFDLIIIDEAHRSIFKKYRAIFEYFDSILVGLTATPKTDVDRNTYDFFEMEHGVPTYAYDYETAVKKDHVLVPYYNIEVTTKILDQGITYDDLSEEEKERYEEDFTDEDGELPEYIPPAYINEFIFNSKTVDMVLEDLMTKGIKVAGGDRIGKTIIFAQNKNHAQFIVERFNKLYPQYKGGFIKRVVCDDSYAQTIIDEFKIPDKEPHIAVSVDMLDTGIDVPEIVNLIFFKKVRSKVKFWQMIGRGTRLCKDLFGKSKHKEYFVIFDYLGNFEFFRQNKEGLKGNDTKGLSELIFSKRVSLIYHLQDSAYTDEEYQNLRRELIDIVVNQIQALNAELVSVRLQLKYIEKYKTKDTFTYISELDKHDMITYLAPIVFMDDNDEYAKRFDNFMYSLMLDQIKGNNRFKSRQKQLKNDCIKLSKRATIPQIKEKLELINSILTDEFWNNTDILSLEKIRAELRDLMKFLSDVNENRFVYTNISDEVLFVKEGEELEAAYDFTDYRLKVNRYIEENKNHIAIYKLRNNIPLTKSDYAALEKIFTKDLGTKEDYKREFGDTPFGLLIRKIAKLEYDAAMSVFSDFINEQSLNQEQIVFINKIIDYIVQNGYIEDISTLVQPPFDKPHKFVKLFDRSKQMKIVELVNRIKENAINVVV